MIVCITGTSRGIGKALSKIYSEKGNLVIGGARVPQENSSNTIQQVKQDVSRPKEAAVAFLKGLNGRKIDLLIHNAGVYPEKGRDDLQRVDASVIANTVRVNAAAPLEITRHLLQNQAFNENAKVVGISSQYGSISDTHFARDYSYAMSKAAMNMGFRIMACELERETVHCFVMSPGWIKTDMGGKEAPLLPEETCPLIVTTIQKWKPGAPYFIDYNGRQVHW